MIAAAPHRLFRYASLRTADWQLGAWNAAVHIISLDGIYAAALYGARAVLLPGNLTASETSQTGKHR